MKGDVRERGNGRLEGGQSKCKGSKGEGRSSGMRWGGLIICLAQMESIFAPFHQSCARVWIKAESVLWESIRAKREISKRIYSPLRLGAPQELQFHKQYFCLMLTPVKLLQKDQTRGNKREQTGFKVSKRTCSGDRRTFYQAKQSESNKMSFNINVPAVAKIWTWNKHYVFIPEYL